MMLALILFLLPLAYSPGPGNMVFATIGACSGWRASLAPSFGYHLATWSVTAAIGLGFASVATMAPLLFVWIGYAGSVYVIWLALRFWFAAPLTDETQVARTSALDGAILLLLNPKAYVIIAAMFAQFLPSSAGFALVLWIATIFTLNNLVAFSLWTLAGDLLLRRFRDQGKARLLNRGFALVLACVAVWMLQR